MLSARSQGALPTLGGNLGAASFLPWKHCPRPRHKPPTAPGRAFKLKNKENKPLLAKISFLPGLPMEEARVWMETGKEERNGDF